MRNQQDKKSMFEFLTGTKQGLALTVVVGLAVGMLMSNAFSKAMKEHQPHVNKESQVVAAIDGAIQSPLKERVLEQYHNCMSLGFPAEVECLTEVDNTMGSEVELKGVIQSLVDSSVDLPANL